MAEFLEKNCKTSANIVKLKGFFLDYFGFSSKRIKYNGFYWQNIQFPCQKFLRLKFSTVMDYDGKFLPQKPMIVY